MEVAATAGGGGGAKTPDEIIAKHCNACHGTGLLGAPKIGDTAAWKDRADHQGASTASWPRRSRVSMPCRQKAPVLIARMLI